MGNQQAKVGLRLEKDHYEAGGVITGRVYLSLPKSSTSGGPNSITGLHLLFTGEEYAQVSRKHKSHKKHHPHHTHEPVIERSTHVLVRNDFPLVNLRGVREGQYEYPFELPVPPELPSSMQCQDRGNKNNYCEIRFKLTAYLVQGSGFSRSDPSSFADTSVHLLARGSFNTHSPHPLLMEADSFPVNSCCFWNKGHIKLGWQADRAEVAPGEKIQIDAFGENQSKLDVESIRVKWIETTTWKTGMEDTHRRSVKRTIAEQAIAVGRLPQWVPRSVAQGLVPGDSLHQPVHFCLQIPRDARDSYTGPAVHVRHMLVVKVATAGGITTTSPESACQVRVHRTSNEPQHYHSSNPVVATATVVDFPPDTTPASHCSSSDTQNIVQAQALPSDWNPVQADVVVIPEAAAVVIDEDAIPEAESYLASAPREHELLYPSASSSSSRTPHVAPTLAAYQATAPAESLLNGTTANAPASSDSNGSDTVSQLRTIIADSPENLSVILTDPAWANVVQQLDPREFCFLVSAAPTKAADGVAQTLATIMARHFQCRYVVACIWALPDDTRMTVVCAVARLPADLQTNRPTIEQELRDHELAQFRQALHL